jgi:beta-N-acetylhexosaminidase
MRLNTALVCFLMASTFCITHKGLSQSKEAAKWADSVFNSLTDDQRIAQLLVVRSSGMDASGAPAVYDDRIDKLVAQYNIGAICAFQGTPQQHAAMLNRIQAVAKTPIMVTVDAEWGLGMRFAGVQSFPYQLTMGAVPDAEVVYKVGKAIGDQLRRMNIHVNYAPVVDINNNPNNPVIGLRSFGEDKYKVALMGTRIMEGMQERGIMACAKHFPGHGDVSVDSHYDLPVINKSREELDDLELYPFEQLFKKGVASVMVAHLYIPSIDTIANQATSLSYKNITGLMRNELGYQGLTFTDALEMKGVAKFYPGGEAAVQSLIAGNDMLCLPADVAQSIAAIKEAVTKDRLTWAQVYDKCKRVLLAKYDFVYGKTTKIDTNNLTSDLNASIPALRKEVAQQALTVLALKDNFLPIPTGKTMLQDSIADTIKTVVKTGRGKRKTVTEETIKYSVKQTAESQVAYIAVGSNGNNELAKRLKSQFDADVISLPYNDSQSLANFNVRTLKKYKKIIIGLHGIGRSPARNFGVPVKAVDVINIIQSAYPQSLLLTFGNPYINSHFTNSPNLLACYEDDSIFQGAAADWLSGQFDATGTLPVTVGSFKYGTGIVKKKPLN